MRCYPRGKTGGASCIARHGEDDPLLGQPIDPESYDYEGAVLWNAHAPLLWARFTIELRRAIVRVVNTRASGDLVRLSQRRLLASRAPGAACGRALACAGTARTAGAPHS
ncbi:MAG: replication initiator [Actinomycetes bacterium]